MNLKSLSHDDLIRRVRLGLEPESRMLTLELCWRLETTIAAKSNCIPAGTTTITGAETLPDSVGREETHSDAPEVEKAPMGGPEHVQEAPKRRGRPPKAKVGA
jgi:hypothetical protein